MSWQRRRRRVSVLADMAIRREAFIANVARNRELKGRTQEQAAHDIGVTYRQWQRWEAGESMPRPANLDALATYFTTTIGELLDEQQPMTRLQHLQAEATDLRRRLDDLDRELNARRRRRRRRPSRVRRWRPASSSSRAHSESSDAKAEAPGAGCSWR